MTSNVGSHYMKEMASFGFASGQSERKIEQHEEEFKHRVKADLKGHFKPEFLNRIDEIIIFKSLRRDDIEKIVDIQLAQIKTRLEKRNIAITIDPSTRKYIVENGFDPDFGARPIARLIQKTILDAMADKMIRGQIKDGDKVKIAFADEKPVISIAS
jgi:ATP-dependent Clp protease ATP-binding subunit ClpA